MKNIYLKFHSIGIKYCAVFYVYITVIPICRYGKVPLRKPSLLSWCPGSLDKICGRGLKVEAPCDETGASLCVWKNFTYQAVSDGKASFNKTIMANYTYYLMPAFPKHSVPTMKIFRGKEKCMFIKYIFILSI